MEAIHHADLAYPSLSRPGKIGTLALPHRILMGAMHLGIEGEPELLERLKQFYAERASGQAALIITGGAAVHPAGGGYRMFCLTEPAHRAQLGEVAEAVHAAGGRIALQLFHAGRYAFSAETGLQPVAPSAVPCKWTRETPREMSLDDIQETVALFAQGARAAKDLGFDAVEVMGSEGYLLNQFLSPVTNLRTDEYGGTLEGRMRISLEVAAAIREAVGPDFPVIFRMSGADCMPGSTTWEETVEFARRLEQAGVDALNVGIGWHESRVPTVSAVVPRAAFAPVAAGVRAAVKVPVIAANRINTPEVAEEVIAQGWADFVAPARPWLADPAFAAKALQGDRKGLNVCIACNQSCLDHVFAQPPVPASCLVNPRAGQEMHWPQVRARRRLRVAVVGGGAAGLEAARTAAQRGHDVTLYEARPQLGGQLQLAARVPGKGEFYETLRYYEEALRRLSVTVRLAERPSADDLVGYDEVILATGVVPFVPDIPGVDLPHVATYAQVFNGEVPVGRKIVILGAGGIGCDLAHFLAEHARPDAQVERFYAARGLETPGIPRTITVVSRSERVAVGVGRTTRWVLRDELRRLGVQVITNFHTQQITEDGVVGEGPEGPLHLAADQVILCTGQRPQDDLKHALAGRVRVHVVGGARDTRGLNAARAIREAFETVYRLGEDA